MFLRKNFPCDGEGHVVATYCLSGMGTAHWLAVLSNTRSALSVELETADLALFDTANNDIIKDPIPAATGDSNLKSSTCHPTHLSNKVHRDVELLIRVLDRSLVKTNPGLDFVWVTAGWRNRLERKPYHTDSEHVQAEVLRYYGFNQLSLLQTVMPLVPEAKRKIVDSTMFADGHGHPSVLGHQMLAQVVGTYIFTGLRETAGQTLLPPQPPAHDLEMFWATECHFHRLMLAKIIMYDFRKSPPDGLPNIPSGWLSEEDVPKKRGVIARQSVAAPLDFLFSSNRPFVLLSLGVLRSYEHMGFVHVQLFRVSTPDTMRTELTNGTFDCLWTDRVSVGHTFTLDYKVDQSQGAKNTQYAVQITVAKSDRAENKVKLHHLEIK